MKKYICKLPIKDKYFPEIEKGLIDYGEARLRSYKSDK